VSHEYRNTSSQYACSRDMHVLVMCRESPAEMLVIRWWTLVERFPRQKSESVLGKRNLESKSMPSSEKSTTKVHQVRNFGPVVPVQAVIELIESDSVRGVFYFGIMPRCPITDLGRCQSIRANR